MSTQKTSIQKTATGDVEDDLNFTGAVSLGDVNVNTVNVAVLTGIIPGANGGTGVANSHTITTTANATIGGTNTGDQTSVTGNAGTATALATARTINGTSFDGTANITVPSDIAPGTSGNLLTSNGTVWTSAAPTGGAAAETGDVKFVLDSATVGSGWGLTGINGIPAFTTPDADYKAVIKMAGTVATPTASPAAGEVADGSTITFSSTTPGVTFIRKTDGADPARGDGTTGGTATLSGDTTYKVRAYIDGQYLADSAVATFAYTIAPPAGPTLIASDPFNYTGGQELGAQADWTTIQNSILTIDGTRIRCNGSGAAYYDATLPNANHRVEITIAATAAEYRAIGAVVRAQGVGGAFYTVTWGPSAQSAPMGGIRLKRVAAGGTETQLVHVNTDWGVGHKIALEATGTGSATRLTVYIDTGSGWTIPSGMTSIDPGGTYLDGGYGGVYMLGSSSLNVKADDFALYNL
jgi:hypothetical protein